MVVDFDNFFMPLDAQKTLVSIPASAGDATSTTALRIDYQPVSIPASAGDATV